MKYLKNPVVCDYLYAKGRECPPMLGRLALHSYDITLMLPSNIKMRISAEIPEEFENFLAEVSTL